MAKKNMIVSVILSAIVTGLGLAYVGEMKKFLYYIIIQVVLGVILYSLFGIPFDPEENTAVCLYYAMLIVWVVGLYDTIRTTRELNMGY